MFVLIHEKKNIRKGQGGLGDENGCGLSQQTD